MERFRKWIAFLALLTLMLALTLPAGADHEVGSFTFTHFASGGIQEELPAIILLENKNSTFTKYQVAFPSCTCRDAASNYWSVMYVELLNTKDTRAEAAVRAVSFGYNNKDVRVGLWGDSDPIMGHPEYTSDYMDENFVQKLVGVTKADVDGWDGYGTQLDAVDVDAVSGATVSTSNITSVLRSLFEYHCDKYYSDKE